MNPVIIGNATLYLGDSNEIMRELAPCDAVVTDPPYLNLAGTYKRDFQGGVGAKLSITQTVGDPWLASLDWVEAAASKASKALMVFCSFQSVGQVWQALSAHGKPVGLVTWYKRNAAPTGKNVPHYTTEFIWVNRLGPGPRWDDLPSLIDEPNINPGCMATERIVDAATKAVHPSQKPMAVMRRLLLPGIDSVFDPFMGTGTTGVAAVELGRTFIGIEIDSKYFDLACERIENAQRQQRMFA